MELTAEVANYERELNQLKAHLGHDVTVDEDTQELDVENVECQTCNKPLFVHLSLRP